MFASLLPHVPCNSSSHVCRMPLAAVGYLDGTLAIYDLSTQSLRHKCQHEVLPSPPTQAREVGLGLLEISFGAQGPVPNLYFSLSLGLPQRAAAVSAKRMCLARGDGRHHEGVGVHGGSQALREVSTVVSPCCSQGSCSCCGRRARPWCTPAAWTGLCGSGTPARGR